MTTNDQTIKTDATHGLASEHRQERTGLIVSLATAVLMAGVGLTVTVLTSSQAILLDGMFNAVYAVAAAFTLHVSGLLRSPSNARFPYGYAAFVPLVNLIKSLLIAGVSFVALWNAIVSLFSGGNEMSFGGAIAYSMFSTTICTGSALIIRRKARAAQSNLLDGDVITWSINAAISACLLVSFAIALALQSFGFETAARYVDSILVTLLVAVSIGFPYSMGKAALSELLARSPAREERAPIEAIVREGIADLRDFPCTVRSLRIGDRWQVHGSVTVPKAIEQFTVDDADRIRDHVEKKMVAKLSSATVFLTFSKRTGRT